ncbi:M20 family metallopeptidase [Thermosynechococcaceae cyanobacterium BACA0444]|uniref:M20 family metallopeptidase n=1 Tax=Pseudocalidococcus azoricus BACA0444 TaxID=2918990 RepID=A0AAE4FSG8_9CYAN|nr:M20 family metallopeptidase [Pseudocalidococcus azoricus]MDS3861498.1 M20 family metallopeptidase [Pseudocalidococcus azoricus BACA0444]
MASTLPLSLSQPPPSQTTEPSLHQSLRPAIKALQPELVAWRRYLHQRPELAFKEQLTASFVAEKLREWGIPHQTGIAETGIVAILEGSRPGPVLGIRADMDALPIQEENQVPYRSSHDGVMHACGHDGHTTIALGTARYLSQHPDFAGTVKIIFQPAEEGPGGAKPMIQAGVLDNPKVDAIIGLHVWNVLPVGTVGVRSGPFMAAAEFFHCQVLGKGGHGAIPQQTIDAVLVASQIVTTLQTIVARNINPLDTAVISVGSFHGGTAKNIIADTASLSGTVRYFNPELADKLPQRIEEIIAGVCACHGAKYELNYQRMYPATINDPTMAELVRSVATTVIETELGVVPECQTMAAEDMSFFLQQVPGCYFFLGSANAELGLDFPHHHPRFDFDETVLGLGVEIFVRCLEKFFAQAQRS